LKLFFAALLPRNGVTRRWLAHDGSLALFDASLTAVATGIGALPFILNSAVASGSSARNAKGERRRLPARGRVRRDAGRCPSRFPIADSR